MRKFEVSLPSAEPSRNPVPPALPTRLADRCGRNQSTPTSTRSPTNTMVAGLLAPPKASSVMAAAAPPMPLAFMP
jgi:hypothetical protein